jgi:hypothetical protein
MTHAAATAIVRGLRTASGLAGLALFWPISATPAEPRTAAPAVVVVELFTSQGCATCPAADALMTRLGSEGGVLPLAFHVDFWNRLGWRDPFSSPDWTRRQEAYARALGAQIYTPQAIVAGRVELVGSEEAEVRAAIERAAALPTATIGLRLEVSGDGIRVDATVSRPDPLAGRKQALYLVVLETGLVTPVGGGENDGRTLHNDYVVRSLERVARLPAGETTFRHSATLATDPAWDPSRVAVAGFLQEPSSMEIHGAGVAWLVPSKMAGAP